MKEKNNLFQISLNKNFCVQDWYYAVSSEIAALRSFKRNKIFYVVVFV